MPQKRKLSSEASQSTSKSSRRGTARQTPPPAESGGNTDGGKSTAGSKGSSSTAGKQAASKASQRGGAAEEPTAEAGDPAVTPVGVEADAPEVEKGGDKQDKRPERPASTQSRASSRQEDYPDQESESELNDKLKVIEEEKKQILDATHPEIVERTKLLRDICDRRIAAAKRFCDLQIENIRGLYDFEIQQADTCYQAGVEELKEIYSEQIDKKISALQHEQRDLDRRSHGPTLSASLRSAAAAASAAINDRRFAFGSDGNHAGESSGASRIEQLLNSRCRPHQRDPVKVLSESLTDAEIRGDMKAIVNDLKQRAQKFTEEAASRRGSYLQEVSIDSSVKPPALVCGSQRFHERQQISLYSRLSNQTFGGTIVRVEEAAADEGGGAVASGGAPHRGGGEVIVLLADGTYARIYLEYLRVGRLVLEASKPNSSNLGVDLEH